MRTSYKISIIIILILAALLILWMGEQSERNTREALERTQYIESLQTGRTPGR